MGALEGEGELSEGVPANGGVCGALCANLLREVLEVVTTTISDHRQSDAISLCGGHHDFNQHRRLGERSLHRRARRLVLCLTDPRIPRSVHLCKVVYVL